MVAQFQSAVNFYEAFGVVGDMILDGPVRSGPLTVNSSGTPNLVGNAFTLTNTGAIAGNNSNQSNAGTCKVGGTGLFAGILVNSKAYSTNGGSGGPLTPTLAIPDNSIGEFMGMGQVVANLPGGASVGDLVTYDPATGNLNSIPPITTFTASIAAGGASTADVLTVTAVTAGKLAVGQIITGAGVQPGTYIVSLGTGKGYTGTYNLSTINLQTVSSEAMTAPNVPELAFAASVASIATSAGVDTLTITTLTSGQLAIGTQIVGAGVLPNTVITAFGSGVGGTGTYTLNTSGQTVTAEAMTGPAEILIPNCSVSRFVVPGTGGLAVIKLTN